jgi:hypothetical protein
VAESGDINLQPGETSETLIISRPLRLVNIDSASSSVIIGATGGRKASKATTGFVSRGR